MRFLRSTLSAAVLGAAFAAAPGMVEIAGGEFLRGRSHPLPDDGLKWVPFLMKDDQPARKIYLDAFQLDEHEVTNAQYAEFVRATRRRAPYNWPKDRMPEGAAKHPVVDVSWDDAEAYAKWAGKRLPTEAEWERACRGSAEGRVYPWGDEKPTEAHARFNRVDGPGAVCLAAKSSGLCDIAGNVWEWTADWYAREYYREAPERNPAGPETGMYRTLRGGSWADEAKYLTCANRSWARPAERSPNIGFRCAKTVR